ncbi:hypothetical protein V1264_020435 [Littorina saxatilis]|uniref:Glutathione S-transferase n=1 Tax=Littorina saxatilis TaxID=31220 RepID=A0AAN9BA54_9CAEN
MSELKVVYFDLRARGEPIRLVLEAAGKKYEDVRLSFDEWPAEKPNTPYGQLPYIVYNGKKYGQSLALANFVAREFGLYGKTNLDALRIDEVSGLTADLVDSVFKAKFENDETKKAELSQKLWDEAVPKYFGFFNTLLSYNGNTGFFVGSTVSLADLLVFNLLDSLIAEKAEIANTFSPELNKLRSNVQKHPFLNAYLAKRKNVPF